MMTTNIYAERGTRVSTPRPRAGVLAPVCRVTAPFAAQHDTTDVSVSGPSAWSPPI